MIFELNLNQSCKILVTGSHGNNDGNSKVSLSALCSLFTWHSCVTIIKKTWDLIFEGSLKTKYHTVLLESMEFKTTCLLNFQ